MSQPGVFERTRVVSAEDLDQLGHVNNVVWLRFVVELAEAHARASGGSENPGGRACATCDALFSWPLVVSQW